MTDKTSISILLNSSRQLHAPYWQSPENNLFIIIAVIYSEQLNTIQSLPNPLAKSFVDSVLPDPLSPEITIAWLFFYSNNYWKLISAI